jgi:hypothetical protein
MEEYTIKDTPDPDTEPPIAFITSVWEGKGGTIHIEPGALPSKILWELKQVLRSLAVGFQWSSVNRLKDRGMHGEHAEAYITTIFNKLIDTEVPPIPSEAEMDALRAQGEADEEDGSSNQVP